jgi:hypothetical protein
MTFNAEKQRNEGFPSLILCFSALITEEAFMTLTHTLSPTEWDPARPFTHPEQIRQAQRSLRYMAGQVAMLLANPYLAGEAPHTVFFNHAEENGWFHRAVISEPEPLSQSRPLTLVGFFGEKQEESDSALAHEFDRLLIEEIEAHPGLLSYSTTALGDGDYANLVIFSDPAARDRWSESQAHAQAVRQLAPNYYRTVTIFNGRLPGGLDPHPALTLVRAKYYDYQSRPRWQAVRALPA